MAKWKNEGKAAVVVNHKLVYPGEVVEVPEKMVKGLPGQTLTPAPLPEAGRGGKTLTQSSPINGRGEEEGS